MAANNLVVAAAPLLRKLMPAEARSRRLPMGLALPLYQAVIAERLTVPVFEAQYAKLLRLPLDADPGCRAIAKRFERRLHTLNDNFYSSSKVDENHSASKFEETFQEQLNAVKINFLKRYSYYMHDLDTAYDTLKAEHGIEYYPFEGANIMGKAMVMLADLQTYHELSLQSSDPKHTFNHKCATYYTGLFRLTDTFLHL